MGFAPYGIFTRCQKIFAVNPTCAEHGFLCVVKFVRTSARQPNSLSALLNLGCMSKSLLYFLAFVVLPSAIFGSILCYYTLV